MQLMYPLLRDRAKRIAANGNGNVLLRTTELVHEAYLRLYGQSQRDWQDREHFLAVAAMVMRNLLRENIRSRNRQKRGGDLPHFSLEEYDLIENKPERFLQLCDALDDLSRIDARKAQVLELKYFAAMTAKEIAVVYGVSERTIKREIKFAKAWLKNYLTAEAAS